MTGSEHVDPLDELGTALGQHVGDGPDAAARARVRARVLGSFPRGRRACGGLWWRVSAVVPALLLLVWWWDLGVRRGASIDLDATAVVTAFPAGRERLTRVLGGYVSAETWIDAHEEGARLEFRDGSRIEMRPLARAQVLAATDAAVRLDVARGELAFDIEPAGGGAWRIDFGPFRVDVLGTAFTTRWDEARLVVEVTRGVVRVSGGRLGEDGARLTAGGRLELEVLAHEVPASGGKDLLEDAEAGSARRTEGSLPAGEESTPEPMSSDSPPKVRAEDSAPARRRSSSPPSAAASPARDWQGAAVRGDHKRAIALAEEAGFSGLLETLGPREVRHLADAARYARSGPRALEALRTLRRRFPETPEGQLAAFLLGRVMADVERDYASAASWFRVYLKEHPSGTLADQARGRLMHVLSLAGEDEEARTEARRYLADHPGGEYRHEAKALLDGGTLR